MGKYKMTDYDLIALLEGMAYQIEGEAREVRANADSGPDWATTTISRHGESLDCDATVLRNAVSAIMRMRVALNAIKVGAPPDMEANDPHWVSRVAKEALGP